MTTSEVGFAEGADKTAPFAGFDEATRARAQMAAAEVYHLDAGTALPAAMMLAASPRDVPPAASTARLRPVPVSLPAREGPSAYVVADGATFSAASW